MSNQPSLDLENLDDYLEVADATNGTLALTSEGRLIVYGIKGDLDGIIERINKTGSGFNVRVEPAGTDSLFFLV